ncbi:TolC family protein [Halanaerobiaceae bacterium Z-7014]|uniref:TolC family protein n=1 Tax=Halonatronomonas betaini TaxID=2778430 RepID=A0A931AS64_9FIRM|nr:TolC family protein [Halonatronomonas betaini]MBF8437492.1 TolC family protein [Halonatronomonas betaini]
MKNKLLITFICLLLIISGIGLITATSSSGFNQTAAVAADGEAAETDSDASPGDNDSQAGQSNNQNEARLPDQASLQEIIDLALENNYGYSQLQYQLEEAEARKAQLEAGLDWRGDLLTDLELVNTPEVLKTVYDIAEEDIDDYLGFVNFTVAASRDIISDPETDFQREALELDISDSELELSRKEQELIVEVAGAYYDLKEAKTGQMLAERAVEISEKQLEQVQVLYEAEEATETDLKEVELEIEEARDGLETAKEMVSLARENLEQTLGEASLDSQQIDTLALAAAEEIDLPEKASPWPWDLEASKEIARDERLDLERLRQAIDLIDAEEARLKDEQSPDFTASFSYRPADIDILASVNLDDSGRLITSLTRVESNLPDLPELEDLDDEEVEQILEDLLELVDVSWDDFNDIDLDQNGIDLDAPDNQDSIDLGDMDQVQTSSQNNNNLEPMNTSNNSNSNSGSNSSSTWQISLGMEYNFYDSGLEEEQLREIEAERKGQLESLAEAESGIGLEVEAQWQELESAYRELRNSKSNLNLASRRLSDGDHLLETEMITEYEYNMLELNYYQASADVITAYYHLRQEQAELALALGLSADWYRGELGD